MTSSSYSMLSSVAPSLFFFTSFVLWMVADWMQGSI
jgi:hypothetical protein